MHPSKAPLHVPSSRTQLFVGVSGTANLEEKWTRKKSETKQRVVKVCLMESRSLVISTQWETNREGSGGYNKSTDKGIDIWGGCWLQASNILQLISECRPYLNSPRNQMETWRRRWCWLYLNSPRLQVETWRKGWHNSHQRVSQIFRVRVAEVLVSHILVSHTKLLAQVCQSF